LYKNRAEGVSGRSLNKRSERQGENGKKVHLRACTRQEESQYREEEEEDGNETKQFKAIN
jgi:hypothetical protein